MSIDNFIQKSLWDKVQLIQEGFAQSKNVKTGDRNHPRRQNSDFILSGLARCARCGSPLYGRTSHQKSGAKYQSYLCTLAYRKRGACSKGRIPKPAFEAAVINAFARSILEENNVDEIHRVDSQQQTGLASEQQDQRREILARIASTKKQITNVVNAIAENGSSPALQTRLQELEHHKLELDLELAELEEKIRANTASPLTPEQLERGIKRIASMIQSKDPAEQKTALRGIIAHIDVERIENTIKGTIYYYLPNDDDIIGNSSQDPPPDDNFPPNGDDDVPTPSHPSGPPIRRHIMQYHFIASTKRPRS